MKFDISTCRNVLTVLLCNSTTLVGLDFEEFIVSNAFDSGCVVELSPTREELRAHLVSR